MSILRLQISVHFLNSDFAPAMSVFSGGTENVLRLAHVLYPPWPFDEGAQYHRPVRIERLPQLHLETASRRIFALGRVVLLAVLGLSLLICLVVLAIHLRTPSLAGLAAVGAGLNGLAMYYVLRVWPAREVRLRMVDQAEYLELWVPDRYRPVHDAYKAAYARWVEAGAPRFFEHAVEDSFSEGVKSGWDERTPTG